MDPTVSGNHVEQSMAAASAKSNFLGYFQQPRIDCAEFRLLPSYMTDVKPRSYLYKLKDETCESLRFFPGEADVEPEELVSARKLVVGE